MLAAVDVGSNTLRLLIGRASGGMVHPERYLRCITRLAGGYSPEKGLSPEAMERTLSAMSGFAETCVESGVSAIAAVGTAAFRMAVNGSVFAQEIKRRTGIPLEIITGEREAELMAAGVLSALDSKPEASLIVDIGGGSTELVYTFNGEARFSVSLPLGVVRLAEAFPSAAARQAAIREILAPFGLKIANLCSEAGIDPGRLALIGTAGTVTTLAALDLGMVAYDWRLVNGYRMSLVRVEHWRTVMAPLSPQARESLPGMEAGRGDLIVAGIEIIQCIMSLFGSRELVISDFGILEGQLLVMAAEGRMDVDDLLERKEKR